MEDFINKFSEEKNIKNTDYTVYDVYNDGSFLTRKVKFNTLISNLSANATAGINNNITDLQNNINSFSENVKNKLDRRGLSFNPNEVVTGDLSVNNFLSSFDTANFNSDLNLHNTLINNVSSSSFNDTDLINKKYIDDLYNSIQVPNMNLFVNKTGDLMTGFLNITSTSFDTQDLVNKNYVDDKFSTKSGYLSAENGVMDGALNVLNPTLPNYIASKDYVDSRLKSLSSYLPLSGGKLTNKLYVVNPPDSPGYNTAVVSKSFVDSKNVVNYVVLDKSNTMAGNLSLGYSLSNADSNWAVTKQYVDDNLQSSGNFVLKTGSTLTGYLTTYPITNTSLAQEAANVDYVKNAFQTNVFLSKVGGNPNNIRFHSTNSRIISAVITTPTVYNLDLHTYNTHYIDLYDKITGFTSTESYPDLEYTIDLHITDYSDYNNIISNNISIPTYTWTNDSSDPANWANVMYSNLFVDKSNDLYSYHYGYRIKLNSSDIDSPTFKVYKMTSSNTSQEFCNLNVKYNPIFKRTDAYGNIQPDRSDNEFFNTISCLTFNNNGELLYADNGLQIMKRSTNGTTTLVAGSAVYIKTNLLVGTVTVTNYVTTTSDLNGSGANARFINIIGMVTDSNNNIFLIDKTDKVKKVDTSGNVTTFAGSTNGDVNGNGSNAKFNNLKSIDIDANNNIYVIDFGNNKIKKISPNGDVTTVYTNTSGYIVSLKVDTANNVIYIIKCKYYKDIYNYGVNDYKQYSNANDTVQKLDLNGNILKQFYIKRYSSYYEPGGIYIKNNVLYPLVNYTYSWTSSPVPSNIQLAIRLPYIYGYLGTATLISPLKYMERNHRATYDSVSNSNLLEGYDLTKTNYTDVVNWVIDNKKVKTIDNNNYLVFKTLFKDEIKTTYQFGNSSTKEKPYVTFRNINRITLLKNKDQWYAYHN